MSAPARRRSILKSRLSTAFDDTEQIQLNSEEKENIEFTSTIPITINNDNETTGNIRSRRVSFLPEPQIREFALAANSSHEEQKTNIDESKIEISQRHNVTVFDASMINSTQFEQSCAMDDDNMEMDCNDISVHNKSKVFAYDMELSDMSLDETPIPSKIESNDMQRFHQEKSIYFGNEVNLDFESTYVPISTSNMNVQSSDNTRPILLAPPTSEAVLAKLPIVYPTKVSKGKKKDVSEYLTRKRACFGSYGSAITPHNKPIVSKFQSTTSEQIAENKKEIQRESSTQTSVNIGSDSPLIEKHSETNSSAKVVSKLIEKNSEMLSDKSDTQPIFNISSLIEKPSEMNSSKVISKLHTQAQSTAHIGPDVQSIEKSSEINSSKVIYKSKTQTNINMNTDGPLVKKPSKMSSSKVENKLEAQVNAHIVSEPTDKNSKIDSSKVVNISKTQANINISSDGPLVKKHSKMSSSKVVNKLDTQAQVNTNIGSADALVKKTSEMNSSKAVTKSDTQPIFHASSDGPLVKKPTQLESSKLLENKMDTQAQALVHVVSNEQSIEKTAEINSFKSANKSESQSMVQPSSSNGPLNKKPSEMNSSKVANKLEAQPNVHLSSADDPLIEKPSKINSIKSETRTNVQISSESDGPSIKKPSEVSSRKPSKVANKLDTLTNNAHLDSNSQLIDESSQEKSHEVVAKSSPQPIVQIDSNNTSIEKTSAINSDEVSSKLSSITIEEPCQKKAQKTGFEIPVNKAQMPQQSSQLISTNSNNVGRAQEEITHKNAQSPISENTVEDKTAEIQRGGNFEAILNFGSSSPLIGKTSEINYLTKDGNKLDTMTAEIELSETKTQQGIFETTLNEAQLLDQSNLETNVTESDETQAAKTLPVQNVTFDVIRNETVSESFDDSKFLNSQIKSIMNKIGCSSQNKSQCSDLKSFSSQNTSMDRIIAGIESSQELENTSSKNLEAKHINLSSDSSETQNSELGGKSYSFRTETIQIVTKTQVVSEITFNEGADFDVGISSSDKLISDTQKSIGNITGIDDTTETTKLNETQKSYRETMPHSLRLSASMKYYLSNYESLSPVRKIIQLHQIQDEIYEHEFSINELKNLFFFYPSKFTPRWMDVFLKTSRMRSFKAQEDLVVANHSM